MFKAIKQLLISLGFDISDNIFKNYPNDNTMPADDDFIVMNKLYSIPYCALVQKFETPDVNNKTVDTEANQLQATYFQVDFFGKLADSLSDKFSTTLQCGFANDYFISNNYPFTVKTAEASKQATHPMDRDQYINKFIVRFSLLNNSIVSNNIEAADQVNIDTLLIETINP